MNTTQQAHENRMQDELHTFLASQPHYARPSDVVTAMRRSLDAFVEDRELRDVVM